MSNIELKGLRGLQGLDTLLTDSKSEQFSKENIFNIPVDILVSGKYQPRTISDETSLNELVSSIKSQGILLPLIVRKLELEKYEIIAGERRWRAAKLAQLKTVPAIIRNVSDETALAFALIENIQREALNPIDEALAFVRLKDEFFITHEEIATRVGRSRSAVTNLMRLLLLHDAVKELLRSGKIEMGHARALLSLDEEMQQQIALQIIARDLSVRETEKLVKRLNSSQQKPFLAENKYLDRISRWEGLLTEKLASSVKVNLNSKGEGKVIIHVNSPDEIEWIIANLK